LIKEYINLDKNHEIIVEEDENSMDFKSKTNDSVRSINTESAERANKNEQISQITDQDENKNEQNNQVVNQINDTIPKIMKYDVKQKSNTDIAKEKKEFDQ